MWQYQWTMKYGSLWPKFILRSKVQSYRHSIQKYDVHPSNTEDTRQITGLWTAPWNLDHWQSVTYSHFEVKKISSHRLPADHHFMNHQLMWQAWLISDKLSNRIDCLHNWKALTFEGASAKCKKAWLKLLSCAIYGQPSFRNWFIPSRSSMTLEPKLCSDKVFWWHHSGNFVLSKQDLSARLWLSPNFYVFITFTNKNLLHTKDTDFFFTV